jgi:hypothetical protein
MNEMQTERHNGVQPDVTGAPDVPEVLAIERRGSLVVRCPFCGRQHLHGAAGGYGHRAAHCGGHGGYVLVPPTLPAPEAETEKVQVSLLLSPLWGRGDSQP